MKKKLFLVCAALMCTVALMAQNISVVSSGGSTKLYRTLQAAIEGADPNSTIYLPGGGFPIADSVKITKKLTIIGIGHKAKNDNADGVTTISGKLDFYEGSSGSAVMACYITDGVYIGHDRKAVNDVLIRYCNLNVVDIAHDACMETIVNKNYIRGYVHMGHSNGLILNNLIGGSIRYVNNGVVSNNIIESGSYGIGANNSFISNNIIFSDGRGGIGWQNYMIEGGNNTTSNNMARYNCGDDCINIGEIDWNNVFENYNNGAVSPSSNFHFKEDYQQYEGLVGIYAGDGFNDKQLAPVPYIVAKKIDEQTDAAGKLNIKIRVKASGEE